MKPTLKLSRALLSTIVLASCGGGGGLDQATKDAITKFDSDWAAVMTSAYDWVTMAQDQASQWNTDHAGMDAMMAGWGPATVAEQANNVAVCRAVSTKGYAMADYAKADITNWTHDGEAWTAWKTKADDGEVSQDDATKALEEWDAKLAAIHAGMEVWDTKWEAIVNEHDVAEQGMQSATAPG